MLRSYPANFMKLSPLLVEIWCFETIHCLNFTTGRQKLPDLRVCWAHEEHAISSEHTFLLPLACVQLNLQKK